MLGSVECPAENESREHDHSGDAEGRVEENGLEGDCHEHEFSIGSLRPSMSEGHACNPFRGVDRPKRRLRSFSYVAHATSDAWRSGDSRVWANPPRLWPKRRPTLYLRARMYEASRCNEAQTLKYFGYGANASSA